MCENRDVSHGQMLWFSQCSCPHLQWVLSWWLTPTHLGRMGYLPKTAQSERPPALRLLGRDRCPVCLPMLSVLVAGGKAGVFVH